MVAWNHNNENQVSFYLFKFINNFDFHKAELAPAARIDTFDYLRRKQKVLEWWKWFIAHI